MSERINTDDALSVEAGLLVLAALEGDDPLDAALQDGERAVDPASTTASPVDTAPATSGTFLASLEVRGFRGIGETTHLDLAPQPGLTIVAGRNGSGKSSLAEALEVALTGSTYRWKKKAAQWKEHWRNLHHPTGVEIVLKVAQEGVGVTTIGCSWPDDASEVGLVKAWVQPPGGKRQPGVDHLNWSGALETYRPMMSYDELGGMLEAGPSALYDALSQALGVEQIGDGIRRLEQRHKVKKAPGDGLAIRRKQLYTEADSLPDERAVHAAQLLKKVEPDVGALRELATGVVVVDNGPLSTLRTLESLAPPRQVEVQSAADELRRAVEAMATAGEAEFARGMARLDVRKRALQVHADFGDMTCPVCAGTHLDDAWAESARADVERRSRELSGLEAAREALDRARGNARRLVTPRPGALDRAPVEELTTGIERARVAWDAWADAPAGDLDLARHLEERWSELDEALRNLRTSASEELQRRHDAWAPLAARVSAFCNEWDTWQHAKPTVTTLAEATKWLKTNDTRLKNERLAPISDAARLAWALLRQQSNVDLGSLTLEGSATRRRVNIEASVDGQEAGALAVMSQGELHALSLALFLPRATMDESPFRFIVLDDPVQAMDPAKVDGLVQLLATLAQDRQVVVLSHDDRLPAAARRGRVGARILEVTRGAKSEVSVTTNLDPARRYLDDAFALALDQRLPEVSLRRTLPGMLRFAVEAASRDLYFERRLARGDSLMDVEDAWSTRHATRDRVSLALYDEVRSLDGWLTRGYRKFGLGVITGGMHNGLKDAGDAKAACRAVEDLIADLRTGTKS
ncbi:hypothetical protein N802_10240 [Knoellia sinensis KCTC 19936]|uniref:Nuclease SbcCD subunit C n=1 Tax=Knoellia sinensis KCTC 19936 TaxID=1385520 RepID=A0A0A0IZL8_9MICO|nr:hypothetical protein N802_10240 [Knoellia sinensis KCTC 19936]